MLQRTGEYNRQNRTWLPSTHVEGRNDIRPDSQMPPDPAPSRFSDWSSLGLPPTRTSPHSAPDIRLEQNENLENQLSVPSVVVTRPERVRTISPEEVDNSPETDQQREDQNVPAVVEPAPLNIEARMQRDDVESNEESEDNIPPPQISGSVRPSLNVNDLIQSQNIHQELGNIPDCSRGSHVRTQNINIRDISNIPPVERILSNSDRRMMTENISNMQNHSHEGIHPHRTSTSNRRHSPDDSIDDSRSHRGRGYPSERGRPPEKERYLNSDRRPPRRERLPSNGRPPDRYGGGPPNGGRPSDGGGPPHGGGLPDGGGPPDDGGPPNGNGGPQDALIEEDLQDLEDLEDQ